MAATARRPAAVARFAQCVSVKSIPYKPIKTTKIYRCPIHPLRANCRAINQFNYNEDNNNDDNNNDSYINGEAESDCDPNYKYHETVLEAIYLNYDRKPYYDCIVNDIETRGYYVNASEMLSYVELRRLDDDEEFFGIDEAGERQMAILSTTIKTLMDALDKARHCYVLMVDEMQIDLVYSMFRSIVLPQRMISVYQEEHVPTASPTIKLFSVPATPNSLVSQHIYRTFLIYNTILTMVLKQKNPFNNAAVNISVAFRTLGRCPNNRDRVKCCDLNYGGNAPGHVMCPPREMVRRVFHYGKWARAPNNFKRYYELIAASSSFNAKQQCSFAPDAGGGANSNNTLRSAYATVPSLIILDWYNFFDDFRHYFGIEATTAA